MPSFANENRFDAEIKAATAVFTAVPPALVKAVIGAESGFKPDALRGEPNLGDASYGLMQLLYSTAKRLGYTATAQQLMHPMVNIYYGTKLLAENYQRARNWPDAISAYNGGFRPEIAMGTKATRQINNVCLWWKSKGVCGQRVNVAPGQYANQTYVDKVLRFWKEYEAKGGLQLPKAGEVVKPYVPPEGGGATLPLVMLGAVGLLTFAVLRGGRLPG